MPASEHRLSVQRTARYYTLGDANPAPRQLWFVLHGYGQLAGYFIRHFAPLDDGSRLIVAPEALSRFYVEPTSWKAAGQNRVGASWMTRDDREAEIDDYVGYLDQLYLVIRSGLPVSGVRCSVLGFSQGVATAVRWMARGTSKADQLILWSGTLPTDLKAEALAPLRSMKVVRVLGMKDDMADPAVVAIQERYVKDIGLEAPLVRFDGGHELDAELLQRLAE